jgi:hypothetical protein
VLSRTGDGGPKGAGAILGGETDDRGADGLLEGGVTKGPGAATPAKRGGRALFRGEFEPV